MLPFHPFQHFFQALTAHIETIVAQGGYSLLFVMTILEGVPLFGMVVPGHVAIIAAGFFARVGTLNLYWVTAIAVSGAVLGDFIGFLIGKKYGMPFVARFRRFFFVSDAQIEKTRGLIARHTGKAMIIGRFSPVTRALMPFMVGASHTRSGRFWFFNVIGGASWAILSIAVGYVFGAGYHIAAGYIGKIVVIAVLLGIVIIWGYRFMNIRFHVFARYELFALIMNLLSLWGLAATINQLTDRSFKLGFDVWVNTFMASHVTPFIAKIAELTSLVGGTVVTIGLGVFVGAWFAFRRKWRSAAVMLLSIASTALFTEFIKEFFMSPRPANALQMIVNDPSFPSGHASLAAAFFVAIAYLFAPRLRSWVRRELAIVLSVLAVLAIGSSRLILNVHWASDVIAGWSLGIFCATASILLVRYMSTLVIRK